MVHNTNIRQICRLRLFGENGMSNGEVQDFLEEKIRRFGKVKVTMEGSSKNGRDFAISFRDWDEFVDFREFILIKKNKIILNDRPLFFDFPKSSDSRGRSPSPRRDDNLRDRINRYRKFSPNARTISHNVDSRYNRESSYSHDRRFNQRDFRYSDGQRNETKGRALAEGNRRNFRSSPRFDDLKPSRTLYFGNVPPDIERKKIHDIFAKYGVVLDVVLKKQPHGISYGFVKFLHMNDALKAKEKLGGSYVDRFKMGVGFGSVSPSRIIWVGGFDRNVTVNSICQEVKKYADYGDFEIAPEKNHIYFVFELHKEASRVVNMLNGKIPTGTDFPLQVDFADHRFEAREFYYRFMNSLKNKNGGSSPINNGDYPENICSDGEIRSNSDAGIFNEFENDKKYDSDGNLWLDQDARLKNFTHDNSVENEKFPLQNNKHGSQQHENSSLDFNENFNDAVNENNNEDMIIKEGELANLKVSDGKNTEPVQLQYFDKNQVKSGLKLSKDFAQEHQSNDDTAKAVHSKYRRKNSSNDLNNDQPTRTSQKDTMSRRKTSVDKSRKRPIKAAVAEVVEVHKESSTTDVKKKKTNHVSLVKSSDNSSFPMVWSGRFKMKTSLFPINTHYIGGNKNYLMALNYENHGKNASTLPFTKLYLMEDELMEDFKARLASSMLTNSFCSLIALPASLSKSNQETNIKSIKDFITYLTEKNGAAHINEMKTDPNVSLFVFPPCLFTREYLKMSLSEENKHVLTLVAKNHLVLFLLDSHS